MTMNEPKPREPEMKPKPKAARVEVTSHAKTAAAEDAGRSAPSRRGLVAGIVGAVALVAIGAGVLTTHTSGPPAPHVGITTTTAEGQPFAGTAFLAADNQVTQKQWQERKDAFDAFVAKGPVQLDRAEKAQATGFIDQAVKDPPQQQTLKDQVAKDEVEMVALGFYDDCAEDGDIVRVHSGAVDVTVNLVHRVQYVLVPVPKGQSSQVFVQGIHDGTGGITLGMVTPAGIVHMPPMPPGAEVSFTAR
jgi:hypothetical protein